MTHSFIIFAANFYKIMSQRTATTRQQLIINKLRHSKRATFDDIADYLSRESELDNDYNISKRTFQRDMVEIESIYGIKITYNPSEKSYFIDYEMNPEYNERFFEVFNVYHALRVNEQTKEHIYLENRQSQGTEHLYGLLHAIKKRLQVSFTYQKYYEEKPEQRTVNPLALKEFKYRWYLIARKEYDKTVKIYALDRMTALDFSKVHFPEDTDFDVRKMLQHCFGVIIPADEEPQKTVLSFTPFQGKYIKSLPLHETQEILIDNDKELRISLNIYLTHDFKMEILSYGKEVKVLEPQWFAKEIMEDYMETLEQYFDRGAKI